MGKIRLQIVDDHPAIQVAVSHILNKQRYSISAVARNARQAMDQHRTKAIDAIILDLSLPENPGETLLDYHRRKKTGIPILLFTAVSDSKRIQNCLQNGALGYLLKLASVPEFRKALDAVALRRTPYVCRSLKAAAVPKSPAPSPAALSRRETQVARGIASSLSNKQIAQKLAISACTVNIYRSSLMRKLQISDSAAVTRYAIHQGLI